MVVLARSQACLPSTVTSTFIIDVQSQLQQDPGDETTALRIPTHKINYTTFGNDVLTIPQWTSPPHAMVFVQAILYASLAASLLSAFLARSVKHRGRDNRREVCFSLTDEDRSDPELVYEWGESRA